MNDEISVRTTPRCDDILQRKLEIILIDDVRQVFSFHFFACTYVCLCVCMQLVAEDVDKLIDDVCRGVQYIYIVSLLSVIRRGCIC